MLRSSVFMRRSRTQWATFRHLVFYFEGFAEEERTRVKQLQFAEATRGQQSCRAPCFTLINEAVKHQFFKEQNDDVTNRKRQDLNFIYSVKQETEQNPDEPNRTTTNQIHSVTQGDGFILNWSFFSHVPQNEGWRKSNDDFFSGWNMNSHCPEIKVLENHFPLISATSFGLIAGSEASVRPSVQL